jgi:hypothetical protein
MPLIVPYTNPQPLAVLSGGSSVESAGSVAQNFRATIAAGSELQAFAELLIEAAATLEGSSEIFAFGRLGDEPNVFGLADIGGSSDLEAVGSLKIGGKAILASGSALSALADLAESEAAAFNIFLSITDEAGPGYGATYSARIFADGVGYPIRGAVLDEGDFEAGTSLQVQLQKPSDRAAILAAETFTFDIYDNGAWKPMLTGGRRSAAGYSFAWADGRPNDSLTLSTIDAIAEKLERSPDRNLSVYDPFREVLNAADFEKIYDENGVQYEHELQPIGSLTLHGLLAYVFALAGFDGVFLTIADFPVRRADFVITGSYLEGVAGFLGPYDPLIYVKNNILYALDSTVALPAGLESAIPAFGHEHYKNAEFAVTEQTADGYVVQYNENQGLYDFSTTREITNLGDPDVTGTAGAGDYTETVTTRTYRDYFKFSNPTVPVDTQKIKEVVTVRGMVNGALDEISETTETIDVDAKLRLKLITKTRTALIPNVAASDFPLIRTTVDSERTTFEYKPDIRNPRREYMAKQVRERRGLVAIDEGNPHLDQPYLLEFYDAWRGGNLSAEVATENRSIETFTESVDLKRNGQIEVRSRTANFLTSPPSVHGEITEGRAGDISTNAISPKASEVVVYRSDVIGRTGSKLQSFPIGEMPISIGRPLAKRRLDKRQRKVGSINWKGLNLSLGIGSQFQLFDRGGTSAGFFIVEGRRIQLQNLGTREQSTTQVLQVREVATNGPALGLSNVQPSGLAAEPGDTRAFSLEIECRDGYELSAFCSNADVRIWGKAEPGDAFQNLHTTPIDLSPYDATVKTFYFELRIDAGADPGTDVIASILVELP